MYCDCIRVNVVKYNPDKCEHVFSLLAHNCLGQKKKGKLLTSQKRGTLPEVTSQKMHIKPPIWPFCSSQTSLPRSIHRGGGDRWELEDISCCPLAGSPCSPLSQVDSSVTSTFSGHVLEVWGDAPSPPAPAMN